MNKTQCDYSEQYNFIYNAINDVQETIRYTDTKSGVVIIVVMGIIAGVVTLIDKYFIILQHLAFFPKMIAILGVIYFSTCLFISLVLSLRSINPANNPNDHIELGDWSDKPDIRYYLNGLTPSMRWEDYFWELKDLKFSVSASEYYKKIEESKNSDLLKTLILELLKLSYIKEKKMQRTKAALKWIEQCIWTAGLTTITVLITYNSKLTPSLSTNNFDYNIFLLLIIGHAVGDFLLQTSWQAENKTKIWKALITHGLIYSTIVYLFALLAGGISLISIVVVFLSHVLLDKGDIVKWWIKTIKKEQTDKAQIRFLVDQSLHVLVLLLVSIIN